MRRFVPLLAVTAALFLPTAAPAQVAEEEGGLRLVVADEGNEVRYRVREQLAGRDLPNDAVGVTSRVVGGIALDADGRLVAGGSRIVVDLASLTSDAARRDNYLRRRTLEVDSFPVAVLVPREARGLRGALPATGEARFQLVADLTVHGVTAPVVWEVTARRDGDALVGRATTRFPFSTFDLEIPRLTRLLSVEDDIRLEYDFRLVPRD